jgi:spore coat protein U-like protein
MSFSNSVKTKLAIAVVGCLALGLASTPAVAATTTTTFAVTATVQATCTVTATAMGFGTYVPTAASTSTSTISVTCTNTSPYNVGLNPGTASGATVTTRKMTGPNSALLSYQLTQDSAHTINWGQTVGTDTVAGTGNGSAQNITVYGQVAAGQYVTYGAYADTITATVTY